MCMKDFDAVCIAGGCAQTCPDYMPLALLAIVAVVAIVGATALGIYAMYRHNRNIARAKSRYLGVRKP